MRVQGVIEERSEWIKTQSNSKLAGRWNRSEIRWKLGIQLLRGRVSFFSSSILAWFCGSTSSGGTSIETAVQISGALTFMMGLVSVRHRCVFPKARTKSSSWLRWCLVFFASASSRFCSPINWCKGSHQVSVSFIGGVKGGLRESKGVKGGQRVAKTSLEDALPRRSNHREQPVEVRQSR